MPDEINESAIQNPKSKILIVEDSAVQAEMLRRILVREDYEVAIAKNGLEGVEMAVKLRPALVISDISMPLMDGYEMCSHIKQDADLKDIPVILLTQLTDVKAIALGLNAKADWYITKPYSERYLLSKVESVLQGAGEEKMLEAVIEQIEKRKALSFFVSIYENALEQNRELIRTQDELRKTNERLAVINKDLELANIKLKELDRLKSMFIASMSHELRTPLNSIIGFSSVLLNEWAGPINAEQRENISILQRSGKHLLALINDVIDVSKIEAGKLDVSVEDFDLYDVIAEMVTMLQKDITEKGLELKVEVQHVNMSTDRRRVLQCVMNLVGNAVKFTEKGNIRIRNSESRIQNAEFVEVSVEDTGVGIKEDDMPKLFQPFVRLDSPLRSKVKGTGLGLYLTKKLIAEVLKGEITAESEYGKGSRFVMKIPTKIS